MNPTRRQTLRGLGVALTLPVLESVRPRAARASAPAAPPPRRLVAVCTTLGIHGPSFFPTRAGDDYELTPYLRPLEPLRREFTVFSGLSHPGVDGGHESERSFLTAAPHPGRPGFRNTVSLDQVAAEAVGPQTRFASLALSTSFEGGGSLSWSRNGVMVPAEGRPSRVFAKLFTDGSASEAKAQAARLRDGRSVLDAVRDQAAGVRAKANPADRDKLDEYLTAVREVESRLQKAGEWSARPRPKPPGPAPTDAAPPADIVARTRTMFDLTALALRSDSTRVVTLNIQGTGLVPPIEGVTAHHHELSHHGQDPEKLRQLTRLETEQMNALADFLLKLKGSAEGGRTLLDETAVLYGSNLGNANNHDTRNLPILLAGGEFARGRHLSFAANDAPPLSNLYLGVLRWLGVKVMTFGTSTKVLEVAR